MFLRWTLTVVTGLLVVAWLVSGFPGVRWHWPEVPGARQGFTPFGRARPDVWTLWTVVLDRGQVRVAKYRSAVPQAEFSRDLERRVYWPRSPAWFTWPKWSGLDHATALQAIGVSGNGAFFVLGPVFTVSLPLWIPSLLTGVPAALLWRRRLRFHRRRSAGACLRCGYDLAGLPAAHGETGPPTCPECGARSADDLPSAGCLSHRRRRGRDGQCEGDPRAAAGG